MSKPEFHSPGHGERIESARFWYGTLPFPPYQNNAIMPVLRRRKGGKMGADIINTKEAEFFYAKAVKSLNEQWGGIHHMFYDGEIGVCLTLYPPHKRGDTDGPVKKSLDALEMGNIILNDRMVKPLFVIPEEPDGDPRVEVRIWAKGCMDSHQIAHILTLVTEAL